jgi:prepilin-type N-terminal cleavage/methylation domain-containing protein
MRARTAGFSLVELLVAMALTCVIAAAVFAAIGPAQATFQTQPEVADRQQRLRVAAATLHAGLVMAGAGPSFGHGSGPLNRVLAPVLPFPAHSSGYDAARPDVVSVIYVPATPGQAKVTRVTTAGGTLSLALEGNCGSAPRDRLCGFAAGERALLFDLTGRFEIGTVVAVDGLTVQLSTPPPHAAVNPEREARLVAVDLHTYFIERDAASDVPRLMHDSGWRAAFPAVDHMVALELEYFGDAAPPALLPDVALGEGAGPWTTYGPPPPPAGTDDARDPWPAGENCVFRVADGVHVSRLSVIGAGRGPVPLPIAIFTDGPWCPDDRHPHRFDADLLRIRRVRATVRVEVAAPTMRGNGPQFARPGTPAALPLVPDQAIQIDVAPRNLNLEP